MKHIPNLIRRSVCAFTRETRQSDGVLALVIAIALIAAAAALIATAARQNKDAEVARMSGNAKSMKIIKSSVEAYFLGGSSGSPTYRIVCPDGDFNGTADETSGNCTYANGVLPWITLGLSQNDVIDSYGNYFTYVVTSSGRAVCHSVANEYDTDDIEFTGALINPDDTIVRLSSESDGQGTPFYYAVVSHGKNGLGAISSSGVARSAPTSSAEIDNCNARNANCSAADTMPRRVISGPANSDNDNYFDDTVNLSPRGQLAQLCEQITPAQKPNAFVNETFSGASGVPSSLTTDTTLGTGTETIATSALDSSDTVLRLTGGSSGGDRSASFSTASTTLQPAERPIYVFIEWAPTTLDGGRAGFSIATRATASDRDRAGGGTNAYDIFTGPTNDGITVRFFTDTANNANGSTANQIFICDDNAASDCQSGEFLASSTSTFTISEDQRYNLEVYDDGVQIWGRITQVSTPSNTAFVQFSSIPTAQRDLDGNNAVVFVNYNQSTAEVDDLIVARGAMAVSFADDATDADDIVTAGDNFDVTTAGALPSGNLTLETWIRPDTRPTGSNRAAIISKWEQGETDHQVQAYRLYLSGTTLTLDVAGESGSSPGTYTTETHSSGFSPPLDTWTHVSVTFDRSNQRVIWYINGEETRRSSSTAFGTNGINASAGATAAFTVGAGFAANGTTVQDGFDGDISDVRVWRVVRSANQIFENYNRRLPFVSGVLTTNHLLVNWTFDRDNGAAFGAGTVAATGASSSAVAGTLTNGPTYIAMLQQHFLPFSDEFCGADITGTPGRKVGPYQCDFRDSVVDNGDITIPSNLPAVYVKVWGGGGGAYDHSTFDSAGGGGGFSEARLTAINGATIANRMLRVEVGGGGTGSTTNQNHGAGGGGASGIAEDIMSTSYAGIVAGGGGGASTGNENFTGGFNCNSEGDCGPGSGGGGPGNLSALSSVQTSRAPDVGQNTCGGRGGNNTPSGGNPPSAVLGNCEGGGADPVGTAGGSGTGVGGVGNGTSTGGASGIGAGGRGYDGTSGTLFDSIGGGGGGGGAIGTTNGVCQLNAGGGEAGGFDADADDGVALGTIDTDLNNPDNDGSGFGGGGGAGCADFAGTLSPGGGAGGTPTPAGADSATYLFDPDHHPAYCNDGGVDCELEAGYGGEVAGTPTSRNGRQGAVIIKW